MGRHVNFGCGTVTTNYDGVKKYRCTIGDSAFIGCNTNLVSPVHIGDGAYTAAGSTITQDVEPDAWPLPGPGRWQSPAGPPPIGPRRTPSSPRAFVVPYSV